MRFSPLSTNLSAASWRPGLFGGLLQRPHRGAHMAVVSLAPAAPRIGDKIAAAHRIHDVGIVNPGRYGAPIRHGTRRLEQPAPGGHAQPVAWRQMLAQLIAARPHAL